MQRKSMTLAQLAMAFNGCTVKLHCVGRDIFEFEWLADYIFQVDERVRNKQFVHCPERPQNEDCPFFLSFELSDDEEEFFVIRGDNNDVLADFCEIFVEYAKTIRADYFARNEKENQAIQDCLTESFMLDTTETGRPNARTEFIYKEAPGCEFLLARFDRAIDVPFDLVEQRKIAADDTEHGWGYDADNLSNVRKTETVLSQIVARYLDPEGKSEPIELPLRVDSSYLPAWLFDHALLLGTTDESEDSESEESEE